MRVPQLVSDFFEWRWAPCVGLTAGSLAFVALALLFIPTHFGGEARVSSTWSAYDGPRSQRAIFSSSLTQNVAEPQARQPDAGRVAHSLPPAGPRDNEMAARPRGFAPILERAEPLPAAPAAVEPPPPALGTAGLIQPEPVGPAREVTTQ